MAQAAPSRFAHVPLEAPDAIFGLSHAYNADPAPKKANLVVGAYRTDEGKPWVLPVVRKAEQLIAQQNVDHEYIGIDGLPDFIQGAAKLLFGNAPALAEKRIVTCQSISGSGSLRLGSDFIRKFSGSSTIYIPNPTWANHINIFTDAGFQVKYYRYYNSKTNGLDFEGMMADLIAAPEGAVILFHVCAHNPTGVDPTREQWSMIADLIANKRHLPFFDSAYQGFATGNLDNDAFSVRHFAERGIELVAAQSFAKNMGLYGERLGAVHVLVAHPDIADNVRSQLKRIVRGNYSNPPTFGARICAMILKDPALFAQWDQEIKIMANRIIAMRHALLEALQKRGTPGSWKHIVDQIGMFTYLGLNADQCQYMMDKFHVYLTKNGRISMAGLNPSNIDLVADAIHSAVVNIK